jgi:hypothetical protein
MSDKYNGSLSVSAHPCDDGGVISSPSVAMKLDKIFRQMIKVIQSIGSFWMAGDLNDMQRS